MRSPRVKAAALIVAASLVAAACGSSSSSSSSKSSSSGNSGSASAPPSVVKGTINGAGSTLAAPIYQQWGSELGPKGLTVNYSPVGSGAGIADLQAATVDFAGSDPALKSTDRAKAKGPITQLPVAFGAITISYNLSGVNTGLKLDGPTIAGIFLGKITTCNDPAIKALNPGMSLPSSSITVIHRSDSSGTTQGFTTFLSDVSPAWKAQVGSGKDVKWPVGTGGKGNSGVAAAVKQTPGAVGYVEQAYALQNSFTYAAVKNSAGSYILPTIANTSAAATGIKVPPDLGISTINSPSASAYPIVSQTFLDVYTDLCKAGAGKSTASATKSFLTYAFGAGQKLLGPGSNQLPYAPLPSSLVTGAQGEVAKLSFHGAPLT